MLADIAKPLGLTLELWWRFWPQLVAMVLLGILFGDLFMQVAARAAFFSHTLKAPGDVQTCTSAIFSGAKSGDTLNLRETFLVPKDATKTIRPTVGLASERPHFLLFQLEKD